MITHALISNDKTGKWFLAIVLGMAVIVPLLHLAVPPTSLFHISTSTMALLGNTFALRCSPCRSISCGVTAGSPLGHGAFFALGGYAMGMYLMRQIGTRGVYAHPILPDFMVFLNWKELPWYWYGFENAWFAFLMVMAVPGLLAFVFGWFAFAAA